MTASPRTCALKPFSLELKDSAEAYAVMEGLGYEHHTEQRGEAEFHVWFCRVEKKVGDSSAPFKPLALLNYPMIKVSASVR